MRAQAQVQAQARLPRAREPLRRARRRRVPRWVRPPRHRPLRPVFQRPLLRPNAQSSGAVAGARAGELSADNWARIVERAVPQGITRQLAANCAYLGRDGGVLRLALDARNKALRTPVQEDKLAQALSQYFGETVRVELQLTEAAPETPARADEQRADARQSAALASLENDPAVRALQQRFDATLQPESVRPAGARPAARPPSNMQPKE